MANISEMGKALTAREFEISREITIVDLIKLLTGKFTDKNGNVLKKD